MSLLPDFINVIQDSASMMKSKQKSSFKYQQTWWDKDCIRTKKQKARLWRQFRISNDKNDLMSYKICRNKYKSLCKIKQCEMARSKRKQLVDSRKNAKTFWTLLKDGEGNSSYKDKITNIDASQWFNYFKNLLNTNPINSDSNDTLC